MNVIWVLAVCPIGLCVLKLWSKGHRRIKINDHYKLHSECFSKPGDKRRRDIGNNPVLHYKMGEKQCWFDKILLQWMSSGSWLFILWACVSSNCHQRIKMNDHCKPQSQCFCHHSFDELIIPFPAMLMSSYFKLSEQIMGTMLECSRLKNSSVPKFLWIILSSSLCWHSISSILSWQDVFKLRWRI